MENIKIANYYREQYNELMYALGHKPLVYTIHTQFRNTITGEVRLFERTILNKKYFEGKELTEFLQKALEAFVQEKESGFIYNFIPYERARYVFPAKGKKSSWQVKCFYDEKEKESHQFFLRLAREKAEQKLKQQGAL